MSHRFGRAARRAFASLSIFVCGLLLAGYAIAAPTILVTTNSSPFPYSFALFQYDLSGELLSQREIPSHHTDTARDIAQVWGESIGLYHGTFDPLIRVLDGSVWTSYQVPGLNIANNGTYGGIAYANGMLYAGDMHIAGDAVAGIVRIDLMTGAYARFLASREYIDLSVGLDGKLYGLRNMYGELDVIDPATMAITTTLFLGHTSSSRAVAADVDGTIYMASWDGYIARYNATGTRLDTLTIGHQLFDLDIDREGRMVTSDWDGRVYLTDVRFSAPTVFQAGDANSIGAFVAFLRPTPTEASLSIANLRGQLTWHSGESMVDVYRNGNLVYRGSNQGAFGESLLPPIIRKGLRYVVCNAGTSECSKPVVVPAYVPRPATITRHR